MLKTVGFPSTRTGNQTIIDGNLVIATAGKGIDFSADPSAPAVEILRFSAEAYFSGKASEATTVYITPGEGL